MKMPAPAMLLAALLFCGLAGDCRGSLTISLGGAELTNSGAGSIADDAVTLFFEDTGPDTVRLTISANSDAVKVKTLVFNIDPSISLTPASFTHVNAPSVVADSIAVSENGEGLGGPLTGFDITFEFSTSGPNGALYNGQSSIYDVTATGLMASLFDVNNNGGPYFGGVHINKPANYSDSGKYGSTDVQAVPEAGSLIVWGTLTVTGLCVCRRKLFA